ncbi:MAG: Porphobilinogen deaminase [Steroidobacteraceae bacterium]|nr:Porphobilinogen deaminase [Steroidobacteraceae bacterium]
MRAPRTLTIGARSSALSRVQARLVGEALAAHDPRLVIRYAFAESLGDRNLSADLPALLRAGGFTSELSTDLDSRHIDLAVHSWKDLPFTESRTTHIAATLERADPRDLLLVRRDRFAPADPDQRGSRRELRVLSCSARRATNLREFLPWALPGGIQEVRFRPVRGDILRRLQGLLAGDADALVVAKAAIDRLLAAGAGLGADHDSCANSRFAAAGAQVRAALDACRIIVLPLAMNPAAPGQGALAIEVRRDRGDLAEMLAAINHAPTYARVLEERAQLAPTGDEDHPLGVSVVPIEGGPVRMDAEAVFARGSLAGVRIEAARLRDRSPALPRPAHRGAVWTGERAGHLALRRIALAIDRARPGDAPLGFLVARADALPDGWTDTPEPIVWTAGLDTWRKLAARGVWVSGSDESLGETGAQAARHLFPQVECWVKLSHSAGYDTPHAARLATYRLERVAPLEDIRKHTHFFWRSGSQFLEYFRANAQQLRHAWHGCGPGNTLAIIRAAIGPDRVRPFLSAGQFAAELGV